MRLNRKKILTIMGSICLILVFAALPFLAACGGAEPAPTTPAATTPAPTTAKVIKLKYADQDPATSFGNTVTIDPWLDMLEKASNGRVKIERYHAQTLVKGLDLWDAAKYGLSDISWTFWGYYPGITPLADVVTLPFAPVMTGKQNAVALWTLYDEFPELKQSFSACNILAFFSNPYPSIATTPKAGPIKTMADLKGKKIRPPGALPSQALAAMGAVPTMTSAPDLYMSCQKGVLDGLIMSAGFASNFRIDEVLLYYTFVPGGSVVGNYFSMSMNWDSWNKKLPADVKAAWEKQGLIYKGGTEIIGGWVDPMDAAFEQYLKDRGSKYEFYTIPADEGAKWTATGAKPVWDKWIADTTAKGLPAQKVYDRYMELLKTIPPK